MDQHALVEHVLQITEEIGHAAALADWPRAARLVQRRSPLLRSIVREQSPASLELIRKIQAMDVALAANAGKTREALQTEYRAAIDRVSAARRYQQVARL